MQDNSQNNLNDFVKILYFGKAGVSPEDIIASRNIDERF